MKELEAALERNAQLEKLVEQLLAQVASLQAQLAQNSTNSHRPPSSDAPKACSQHKQPDQKSSRKRGGQP